MTFTQYYKPPPISIHVNKYYSINNLLSDMGGFLMIARLFVSGATSFFIFKELNSFMAFRIFSRNNKNYTGDNSEKKDKVEELEKQFRERVSLQGIYDLHDTV